MAPFVPPGYAYASHPVKCSHVIMKRDISIHPGEM